MVNKQSTQPDYDKPVAYDVDGRPLYAHPVSNSANNGNGQHIQHVHMVRVSDPQKQYISDETKLKHERSKSLHPECDLSDGEYVIQTIRRHLIGLAIPLMIGVFLIALSFIVLFNFDVITKSLRFTDATINSSVMVLPVFAFVGLVAISTYVVYYVYTNNKIYLTNESVIQEIQIGLFSKKERMISLGDVEDVSYTQNGILEQLFNIGSIRLSTEGEGTVYYFKLVSNPKEVIAKLKNAVESFKNGRAIG